MEKANVSVPHSKRKQVRSLAINSKACQKEPKIKTTSAQVIIQTQTEAGLVKMASVRSCFLGSANSGYQVLDWN